MADRPELAVLGQPVAHSLSPALHTAAFAAAQDPYWRRARYRAIECDERQLPGLVAGLDRHWRGLSVTMPGKPAAAAVAERRSATVEQLGVANTLVRTESGGWLADNTDVDGVLGALRAHGITAPAEVLLLGGGGTAKAVVAALARLGTRRLVVAGRRPESRAEVVRQASSAGITVAESDFTAAAVRAAGGADVELAVSTVPAGAADPLAGPLASVPALLDAIYHPWPTRLAAAGAAGRVTVTGLDMLLHQAFRQFELFTSLPAPRAAMRRALLDATGLPLPLPV